MEAQSAARVERAMRAVGVDLAGPRARHEAVPVVIRAVLDRIEGEDYRRFDGRVPVEEQQVDPGGVSREDAEVDAVGRDGGTKRVGGVSRHGRGGGQGSCQPCAPACADG